MQKNKIRESVLPIPVFVCRIGLRSVGHILKGRNIRARGDFAGYFVRFYTYNGKGK